MGEEGNGGRRKGENGGRREGRDLGGGDKKQRTKGKGKWKGRGKGKGEETLYKTHSPFSLLHELCHACIRVLPHPAKSQSLMGDCIAALQAWGRGTSQLRLFTNRLVTSMHTAMASSEGGW